MKAWRKLVPFLIMHVPCKIPCAHLAWEQAASRESLLHGLRMDADANSCENPGFAQLLSIGLFRLSCPRGITGTLDFDFLSQQG